MYKNIIRKKVLDLRHNLKKEEKKRLDRIIYESVIENDLYINANKIFIYVSYNNEVDTIDIIKNSIDNNKSVYVPKINIEDKTMKSVEIHSLNELSVNKYGILEPNIVDKNNTEEKFAISFIKNNFTIEIFIHISNFFSFPTEELAKEFLTNFKDLFEQAKYLIY